MFPCVPYDQVQLSTTEIYFAFLYLVERLCSTEAHSTVKEYQMSRQICLNKLTSWYETIRVKMQYTHTSSKPLNSLTQCLALSKLFTSERSGKEPVTTVTLFSVQYKAPYNECKYCKSHFLDQSGCKQTHFSLLTGCQS